MEQSQNVNNKTADQGVISMDEASHKKTCLNNAGFLAFEVYVDFTS